MKKFNDHVESGQLLHDQGICNLPRPPYTVADNATASGAIYSNWVPSASISGRISSLDLFIKIFGDHQRFTFHPTGLIGCTNRTVIVQIRDPAQRPIVSVTTTPGRTISVGSSQNNSTRVETLIQMNNELGRTLLTGRQSGQSITVSSDEQTLGILEGNLIFNTEFIVRTTMGDHSFRISNAASDMNANSSRRFRRSTPPEFNFMANEVCLARVGKSKIAPENCEITLFNSSELDARTKALLIFTGYVMYYAFMAETTFGDIGAQGFFKRICLYIGIFFLVVLIIFVTIPFVVIRFST